MSRAVAYLNGEFLPADEVRLGVDDAGFVMGVTVTERLRTFGGTLFCLEPHLRRLERSLETVRIDPGMSIEQLAEVAEELAGRNHSLLEPGDDLGVVMFVTPGRLESFAPVGSHASGQDPRPTVCLHSNPLPFADWAEKYDAGESLVVTDVQQVPVECWPAELKCRSRMHYYLAEQAARREDPAAQPLLLDGRGHITESSKSNVVLYVEGEGLVSPPAKSVLPGISLAVLKELATRLEIPWVERNISPRSAEAASEILLTGTSACMLPVVRFNRTAVGDGSPGPIFRRLLAAWNERTGLDVAAQARRFASR